MNHDRDTDDFWNAISRIEVSVKNSQDDIRKLYLHSARQEIAIESPNEKIDANQQESRLMFARIEKRFDEHDKRFDKIEDSLTIIVNHL
uniref:hypothetical protein n=1 Tax=Endozoicomonas sp. 4G TaxID=2872754 RepID=UPI002078E7C5|nr:hypothetical protein [Endozoicomonas sp. 4G]